MWKFKKTVTPESNETTEKDSVVLWIVLWYSRYGKFSTNIQREYEAFPDQRDAIQFRESLISAFKLLRHTHGTDVSIYSNE